MENNIHLNSVCRALALDALTIHFEFQAYRGINVFVLIHQNQYSLQQRSDTSIERQAINAFKRCESDLTVGARTGFYEPEAPNLIVLEPSTNRTRSTLTGVITSVPAMMGVILLLLVFIPTF